MNGDLTGIGGPLGRIVLIVLLKTGQTLKEYYEKNPPPPRPDFSTRKTDPDFARKYREWWYYFE